MPELPEVETTKLSLTPILGKTIKQVDVFQPKLRWQVPLDFADLVGYEFAQVERRAKYLIVTAKKGDRDKKFIIHLGMSGSLQRRELTDINDIDKHKHDHVVFQFENTDFSLNYHDPRRFGAILWYEDYADKLFNHLAPEPLSEEFNATYLKKVLANSARAIKVSIMDQKFVVGVGNIYATESLFLSGIHPLTASNALSDDQYILLVENIKKILAKAIEMGGSSLSDFSFGSGKTGYFQQTLYAYGRAQEPCVNCDTVLENIKITGRASVFCPKCQPLKK